MLGRNGRSGSADTSVAGEYLELNSIETILNV